MNRIDLSVEGVDAPPWLDRAADFAIAALKAAGKDDWDLSVLLCDDAFMADLNARFRGKDGPTDVLSFEQGERYVDPEGGSRFLAGDVVVSLETLRRNASEFGVPEDEELKRLVVHGILHLSGMDHATNDPGEGMLARQEAILKELAEERIL